MGSVVGEIPAGQRRKVTRNREFRSCTECRKRKLKCDRQFPCSSCMRRNEVTACVYESSRGQLQSERDRRVQAETKLQHLETLVYELSKTQGNWVPSTSSSSDTSSLRIGDGPPVDLMYNGATHWSAMLEDIHDLRASMEEYVDDANLDMMNDENDDIDILFGARNALSFEKVLGYFLPSREAADRLVAAYFRSRSIVAPFVHAGYFGRMYEQFWVNSLDASPLWSSILFSILQISSKTTSTISSANADKHSLDNRFATASAYCLVIGEYARPQKFAVEALLLYAQAKCITGVDIEPVLGVLFGTLTRLATVMGYHREPDRFQPTSSVFEREMRRRTWSMCMQLDMLVSFQLGLPSNVQFPTWDTRPPTNLLDSDFDEGTVELPLARPDCEPTEILFYITKHRLATIFEKIIRHTLSAVDQPSGEVDTIDQALRQTYDTLPSIFKSRTMAQSVVLSPSIIVTQLCVYFIYQKCLCVLHRKYVAQGRERSIQVCYDAASDLVRRFLDISKQFEPGGQLESERWFMSSITWHDFLTGCAALCLTVCSTQLPAAKMISKSIVNITQSLALLERALNVCNAQLARSRATRKVWQFIEATVLKFGAPSSDVPQQHLPTDVSQGAGSAQDVPMTVSSLNDVNWLGNDEAINLEDSMWDYMQQFVNLPSVDLAATF